MPEGADSTTSPADPAALREWLGAAIDWWREAGVEGALADVPEAWLAQVVSVPAVEKPASQPERARQVQATPTASIRFGGDPAHWPKSLVDFTPWWLTEPSLAEGPADRRVPPAGPCGAPLMVLVAMPEAGDDARLLAGPEGRLLDAILAAIGLSRERIYLASALPTREAMPDWATLGTSGLAELTAHHIALAAPQRLLVLGRSDISSLIPHDPANKTAILPPLNHDGVSLPLASGYGLGAMLAQPVLKRGLWASLVEWSDLAGAG